MAENMANKLDYGVTGSIDVAMEKMSAEQYELALINTYKNLIEMGIDSQDALGILVKANVKKLADDVIAATKGDKDNAEAYKNIADQATKYILSLLYHVPGTIEAEKAGDYKYLIGNGMLMAGVIEGEDFAKYLGTDVTSPYKEKANGKKSKPEAVNVEPVKAAEPEIKTEVIEASKPTPLLTEDKIQKWIDGRTYDQSYKNK